MGFRRIAIAVGAGALMLSLVGVAVATNPAGATTPTGTGIFTCTSVSGQVTYTPAWSNTGKGSVRAALSLTGTGCSGGSPVPATVSISGKGKFPNGSGNCPQTSANWAGKLKITFATVKKSKVTGAFASVGANAQTGLGTITTNTLIIPVVVTGSYATTGSTPFLSAVGPSTGTCATGVSSTTFTSGLISKF